MLALPFSATATILLLTSGAALLAIEFNRPGTIVSGTLGLLTVLLAVASVTRTPNAPHTLAGLVAFVLLLLIDVRKPHILLTVCAAAASTYTLLSVTHDSGDRFVKPLAISSALLIAAGTSILNRVAYRARVNKGLD